MAKSIWNKEQGDALWKRLQNLKPNNKRQWGKMTVSQMLRHIDVAYKNAMGEIKVPMNALAPLASFTPIKHTIIYALPFLKNLPTATEYKMEEDSDFQESYDQFLKTFQKIRAVSDVSSFDSHPFFGKLNRKEWGALLYKHLDHHLRQFSA